MISTLSPNVTEKSPDMTTSTLAWGQLTTPNQTLSAMGQEHAVSKQIACSR